MSGMDLLNSNTDLSYSGFINKISGFDAKDGVALKSAFDIAKEENNINVFNDALDFYLEGQREKREGIDSQGKMNWIDANITSDLSQGGGVLKTPSLKAIYKNAYRYGYAQDGVNFNLSESTFNNLKDFYNEGHREQKEGIDPFGKINWIGNNLGNSYESNLYAIYYLLGRRDEANGANRVLNNNPNQPPIEVVTSGGGTSGGGSSTTAISIPKTKPVKSKPISQDDEDIDDMGDGDTGDGDMGDETLRTEEEDGKILGMPKGVAIGLGVGVLVIGGLLIFKRK
jgi:hypothetical protein